MLNSRESKDENKQSILEHTDVAHFVRCTIASFCLSLEGSRRQICDTHVIDLLYYWSFVEETRSPEADGPPVIRPLVSTPLRYISDIDSFSRVTTSTLSL